MPATATRRSAPLLPGPSDESQLPSPMLESRYWVSAPTLSPHCPNHRSSTRGRMSGEPVCESVSGTPQPTGSTPPPRWNRRVRPLSVTTKCLGRKRAAARPIRSPHELPLFGGTVPRIYAVSVMPCSLAIPAVHDDASEPLKETEAQ